MSIKRLVSVAAIVAGSAILSGPTAAAFMPVIDEFWVIRNGVEQFRDSFNDGVLPPSGPQDGLGGNPDTYSVVGAGGMTSEAGGKLTMTPSLGDPVLINSSQAETTTGALKFRSTDPASGNFLGVAQSFEIHGLFDLTAATLPTIQGQSFSIRAIDRSTGNEGNDTIQLSVTRSIVTNKIGVGLAELDFGNNAIDRVSFVSIESFLADALQIELIISKQANSDLIAASFILYGAGNSILHQEALSTFSSDKNDFLRLFEGENYTRAQFIAHDVIDVPEPGALALLALGLAGLGYRRRRG